MSIYGIKAVLVLDQNGERIVSKYFAIDSNLPTKKEQENFEKNLFAKTQRQNAYILMFGNYLVVYKSTGDLFFYVIGLSHENELFLQTALDAYFDALCQILRTSSPDKRLLLENMDSVLVALDELVDGGILLENDSNLIATRASLRGEEKPLSEQTLGDAVLAAKNTIVKNFLSK
jgi:hypothetical protein